MPASMASNVDSIRKKLPRLQLDQRSSEESEMKRDMKKHVEKRARETFVRDMRKSCLEPSYTPRKSNI